MNKFIELIEKFIHDNREKIIQYYTKCHSYFIDLILSKGIQINSLIDKDTHENTRSTIFSMIDAMNSGLITIGFSQQILKKAHEIYQYDYNINSKNYNTYLDFFELNLQGYINNYLLIVLIEFLVNIDKKKMENLDLFDLIPQGFLKKIQKYKGRKNIQEENIENIKMFLNQIDKYIDSTSLAFKIKDFDPIKKTELLTEIDILNQLRLAKEENLQVLQNHMESELSENIQAEINISTASEIQEQKGFFLLNYFQNFIPLSTDITNKFQINFDNLNNIIHEAYMNLDLEDLFYIISIYKLFAREIPLNNNLIEDIVKKFIKGKVFSTGKYHISNPISILYGIGLFSQLNALNKSEIIDIIDIEMNLDSELNNFNPENSFLNFHTLMGLKLLQRCGGIIKSKEHLLEPLLNFDINKVEKFTPYHDLFYHIASIKLINPALDLSSLNTKYYKLLKEIIQPNGSVNNNLTDTARTVLTLRMLDLGMPENESLKNQYDFIIKHLTFFNSNTNNKFNWRYNKLALKIELRMIFWSLLSFI